MSDNLEGSRMQILEVVDQQIEQLKENIVKMTTDQRKVCDCILQDKNSPKMKITILGPCGVWKSF